MREEAVRFGANQYLVGVLTRPDQPANSPGLLLLNAGMMHRVGPSRVYVRLARRLAEQGFSVLRFDFSGIGDSCIRTDNLTIESALVDDVRQAMDYLEERLGIHDFIIAGHCGGAWVAYMVAGEDERIIGTVLINPEGADDDWVEYDRQRKLSKYYESYYAKEALLDPHRWKKLFTGKADYRSIFNNVARNIVWNRVSTVTFKMRHRIGLANKEPDQQVLHQRWVTIANAFMNRRTRLLLTFSKGSSARDQAHTLIGKELEAMTAAGSVTEVVIPNADHTFTLRAGQQTLMDHIESWCATFLPETIPAN